ncbi:hypothetical protein [Streptomyces sp. MP131-18]|uniref:hypothetical protein n=1 Tax=Streptomyces sp. MP131-18 TaxID=1857892 RepID=UPI0009D16017|nr:hypothetical protein [Streptomyces sp. MP131-18]ONK11061.1 hypothetical protein STBA_17890 [Streptomyces sp. MP131-18]
MTVPEENRPKTRTTDEVLDGPEPDAESRGQDEPGRGQGSTMREALEDAEVHPEDFRE